jgi:N-acyl-D-amino-acid deacylase
VKPGYHADLVVFDPETVAEGSSYEDPYRYPLGIDLVMVNGEVVVQNGEHTGRLPGRVLRR